MIQALLDAGADINAATSGVYPGHKLEVQRSVLMWFLPMVSPPCTCRHRDAWPRELGRVVRARHTGTGARRVTPAQGRGARSHTAAMLLAFVGLCKSR